MIKKHILKPGNHQFAPGSAAIHNNDNLGDAEAGWYLEKYPHIISLFINNEKTPQPEDSKSGNEQSIIQDDDAALAHDNVTQ